MERTFESEMIVIEIKGLIKETEHLLQRTRLNLDLDNIADLTNDLDKVTKMIDFISDKVDPLVTNNCEDDEDLY